MKLKTLTLTSALVASLAAPAAHADNPLVNVQVFRPSAHQGDLITTMTNDIGTHTKWGVGLLFNYASGALVFLDDTSSPERRHKVIEEQLTADLTASFALFDRLSVGLAVPLFLINEGEEAGFIPLDGEVKSFALGDVRLSAKVGLLTREKKADGVAIGIAADFSFPTGEKNSFVSDGFQITPALIVDWRIGPVLIAANVGYAIRIEDKADLWGYADVGNALTWKVGAEVELVPEVLSLVGEVYAGSTDWSKANNSHIEGVIGARVSVPDTGLSFMAGGGGGFGSGYGNTKYRVFGGINFSPEPVLDADEDGIVDEFDKCPLEPEDKDGFEDEDGCPDLDNDGDGISDLDDKCPLEAEDKDGFEDEDGCPDLDNDGDGIPDAQDKCPDAAEDMDGFKDEDGCPDLDNDGDRIPDTEDKCPNEPEVYNGFEDEDGCPDETLAKVEDKKIVILQKIYFDTGKATIKAESFPVLEAVAGIMRANPEIKKISIEGHTDDVGNDKRNLKLSDDRAKSVQAWLVMNGIAEDRMSAEGFGESRPAIDGKTKEAREANRRVEFIIND